MTKLSIFQAILILCLTLQTPSQATEPSAEKSSENATATKESVFYFPHKVSFWNTSGGVLRTERIFLRQADDHPLKIKTVLTTGQNISAEIIKSSGKERLTYTVAVSLDVKAAPGPVSGNVIIKTDHPESDTISIPVAGNVIADIAVKPPALTIHIKQSTSEGHGLVTIASTNGKKLKLLEAKVDLPEITTDTRKIYEGKGHMILVSVSDKEKKIRNPKQALLHISVDTDQRLIVVPIMVLP